MVGKVYGMEDNYLKKENVSKGVEGGAKSPPTIDKVLDEDFLIFRNRAEYLPIYFIPRKNNGIMSDKIFAVTEADDISDSTVSECTEYKRLSVQEVEPSYKLALEHHIARLLRENLDNEET